MSGKTYDKLYYYLERNKSPYLPFEKVASEFREELNVMRGIKQMLFPHKSILTGKNVQQKATNIVNEYIIVKKILVNNSIEETTTKLNPNGTKKVIKNCKFNKRLLQYCLLDLLRFKKLLLMKRRCYLFTYLYDAKGQNKEEDLLKRKKKIERHIADAFNYTNTQRTLSAIGYKPKDKIVSTEEKVYMEDGSDNGFAETMRNFHPYIDERNLRKGGLLSKTSSKVSFRKRPLFRASTGRKISNLSETEFDVNDDFKVEALENELEKEILKELEQDSHERIPGLHDSDYEDDESAHFPSKFSFLTVFYRRRWRKYRKTRY